MLEWVRQPARLCTSAKDNWTNDIRDAGLERWTYSNKRGETFLTLAWAVGHRSYVREKIEADVQFVVGKQGRPMLDCILRLGLRADSGFNNSCAYGIEGAVDPDPEFVELVSGQGANPNQHFGDLTVLGSFLASPL